MGYISVRVLTLGRGLQDGVLKQGQHVLPQAKAVMEILSGNNPLGKKYPFICVTNGGQSPPVSIPYSRLGPAQAHSVTHPAEQADLSSRNGVSV